jgi:drug/metabolite transporter (DMT)-like permease
MNALLPLIAAVLQATSFTLDKAVLNLKRVDYRRYVLVSFPLIALFSIILWLVVQPPLDWASLEWTTWGLLAIMVADIVLANFLFYRALQSDWLNELELWMLTFRIPAILVVAFFFTDERDPLIIILSLISAFVVVWSHRDHTRLRIRRRTAPYVIWGLIMTPIAAVVIKKLLTTMDPVSLELARMVPVAVIFWLLYHTAMKPIGSRSWAMLVATNVFTFTAGVLLLFGYQSFGIIYTGLIFAISPLLVYAFSLIFLGEPFDRRKFIAFLVVLACILVAQVVS